MSGEAEVEGGRRRRRSEEEKRRIVAESFEPGASVSVVARRQDLNTNLLFIWRRRYGSGGENGAGSTTLVPAVIANDAVAPAGGPMEAVTGSIVGRIELELPGGYRLIAGSDVDTAVLGRVIKVLLAR